MRCAAAAPPARPSSSPHRGASSFAAASAGDWDDARSRVVLHSGDYVKTSANGSAEIVFSDGTLYTVRPNTLFLVTRLARQRRCRHRRAGDSHGVRLGEPEHRAARRPRDDAGRAKRGWRASPRRRRSPTTRRRRPAASRRFRGGLEVETGRRRDARGQRARAGRADRRSALTDPTGAAGAAASSSSRPTTSRSTSTPRGGWCSPGSRSRAPRATRSRSRAAGCSSTTSSTSTTRTKTRGHARSCAARAPSSGGWRRYGKDGAAGPVEQPAPLPRRLAAGRRWRGRQDAAAGRARQVQRLRQRSFIVTGRTEPGATIEVNGEDTSVGADGTFTKTVQLAAEGWSLRRDRRPRRLGQRNGAKTAGLRRRTLASPPPDPSLCSG